MIKIQEKLTVDEKTLLKFENVFVILMMVYSALGTWSITFGTKFTSSLMWITFGAGFLLFLYRALHWKDYYKMPCMLPLSAMVLSIGITTLLNFRYSFKENAIFCIYWVLYFFILYARRENSSIETVKKTTSFLMLLFVLYMTVGVLVSLFLMFKGVSYTNYALDGSWDYFVGFHWGRLWGMFINPNNGAISGAAAIIILVYFIIKQKKLYIRILFGLDIFLQLFYISVSDSRSGAVCCGIAIGVFSLIMLIHRSRGKSVWKKILAFLLAIIFAFAAFMVPRKLKDVYNGISTFTYEIQKQQNPEDEEKPPVIDRGYDLDEDMSNRRFDIWKGGVKIFLDSPKTVAVGCSFKGLTDYTKDHQPENYIVSNDYMEMGTLDNEFFNILVGQGLLGILPAIWLVVSVIILLIKRFFYTSEENRMEIALYLAIVLSLSAAAMFVSEMFYHFTPDAVLFWVVLGSMNFILKKDESNEKKEIKNVKN